MHEFERIARFFAPLAAGFPGALGLQDDAAILPGPDGTDYVISTDMLVAGVHFFPDDAPASIARKLLRCNLSDLAAMGANPVVAFLGGSLPPDTPDSWLEQFCHGLRTDLEAYGLALGGGDSVVAKGPISLCLTIIGSVPHGQALLRSGAKPGDGLYVSGAIGDAALGLKLRQRPELQQKLAAEHTQHALERYALPEPRLILAGKLRGTTSACMDISDGLVADAGHIANASGVALRIDVEMVPFSPAVHAAINAGIFTLEEAITGGDDYELLFTAPATLPVLDTHATRIGRVESGSGVVVLNEGKALALGKTGYRHGSH